MNVDYVFLRGVMWSQYASTDAGGELIRALHAEEPEADFPCASELGPVPACIIKRGRKNGVLRLCRPLRFIRLPRCDTRSSVRLVALA